MWWHIFGVLAIVLSVLIAAPKRQSFSFVFTQFENGTGWSSPVYASLIGLLAAQFTMTGYDASACMVIFFDELIFLSSIVGGDKTSRCCWSSRGNNVCNC